MIVVNSNKELKELIRRRIEEQDPNCDLSDIDVSRVKDTRDMFYDSPLEGKEPGWYKK